MLSFKGIIRSVITVILVALSATFHEYAHALAAYKLGDTTAKEQGRLTLNPLAHVDPVGSFVLPLLLVVSGGPVISFAKPVPYNPNRLKNPGKDDALVAIAGPISNFIQAGVGGLLLLIYHQALITIIPNEDARYFVMLILHSYILVNLSLAFFNIIPVPPLDGSKLVLPLLKGDIRYSYYKIQRYAMPILLITLYVLPSFGFDPLGIYMDATVGSLYSLILGLVYGL